MIQPINFPVKLAGNPEQDLQLKTQIKTKDGRTLAAADPKATRALVALMDMNAVLGGAASHYGGPAALADLMSALHAYVFDQALSKKQTWCELFHIINDAGHCENGLYALKANYQMAGLNFEKLKKFRSIESPLTGHGEVHCFPEGVFLSNGPLGSALPQTQGLALGDGLAGKKRVTVSVVSDGASMEGEAKEAFAAIPGFAKQGKLAPYVMIISDNNTKLSGRIDKESFSMQPSFESLSTLGWKVLRLENGHDLQKCYDVISQAVEMATENPQQPIAIHAKTIKGIGTKKTAESSSGGHGFPLKSPTELPEFLKEIYGGEYPAYFQKWIEELIAEENRIKALGLKDDGEKIQNGISAAMIKAAKEGLPVLSVTSDLPGSTGVAGFRKDFPAASIDVGVAESNMVSTAAGLSKLGYIPVVDTFAQFGVTKGALPLIMASLSEAPVIAVFSHTGFQDAADGASHQSLSYLSMTSSTPHVKTYCLTCRDEAEALMYQCLQEFAQMRKQGKTPPSSVFFLGRENFPKTFGASQYQLGKGQVLLDNTSNFSKSATIAVSGSLVSEALKAAALLEKNQIGSIVLNPSCMNELDTELFKKSLQKTKGNILSVEDHQIVGGMGQFLAHQLAEAQIPFHWLGTCAVNGEFGQSAYKSLDLYKKHGLDSESIAVRIKKSLS